MSQFVIRVARRYLRARQQEKMVSIIAGLSFAGIVLGVATLIIVTSVMNGFHTELLSRILGMNGHLRVFHAQGLPIEDYQAFATHLRQHPGVADAHPMVEHQALMTVPNGAAAVMVHGMNHEDLMQRPILKDALTKAMGQGEKGVSPMEENEVFIGKRLAEKLVLSPGAPVTLMVPQGVMTPFGTAPRSKTFRVKGIFEVGMVDYDSAYVFIPLPTAQILFRVPRGVTNIDIFTHHLSQAAAVSASLLNELPAHIGILDWQKANTGYFEAVKVEKNVMFVILTLIIVVAAFNIISSLIMLVKDKMVDIAVLRTLGASQAMILKIFLLVGAVIGVLGATLGGGLGILIALNIENIRQALEFFLEANVFQAEIYFLTRLPSEINLQEVFFIVLMAMLLAVGAAFYPAWRASRLDPVEALRQS